MKSPIKFNYFSSQFRLVKLVSLPTVFTLLASGRDQVSFLFRFIQISYPLYLDCVVEMGEIESKDLSTHTRPYTVGVSIAVVLIFLIAIIHLWKYLLKKIKKWLNQNELEVIETEISNPHVEGRKLSTSCHQQLQMILKYEDEVAGIKLCHTQKRKINRSLSENEGRSKKKQSQKCRKYSLSQQRQRKIDPTEKLIFFAGCSHRHVNEE